MTHSTTMPEVNQEDNFRQTIHTSVPDRLLIILLVALSNGAADNNRYQATEPFTY